MRRVWPIAFLAAEAALYVAFLTLDGMGRDSVWLKYGGVGLCFVAALFSVRRGRRSILLAASIGGALVADWFLLVREEHLELGLICFCLVQGLYFLRLPKTRLRVPLLDVRAGLFALAWILLRFFRAAEPLTVLAALYASNLVCNAIEASAASRSRADGMFAAGLWLLLACDLCVGLHNFGSVLSVQLPRPIERFAAVAMWACYLPSQTLIALSALSEGSDEA